MEGIDKISKYLEIRSLWDGILEGSDRRLVRQNRAEEVEKGRNQLEAWFRENVLKYKVLIETAKAEDVKWDKHNAIFADVLLRADEPEEGVRAEEPVAHSQDATTRTSLGPLDGIPIGPMSQAPRSLSRSQLSRKSVLFPVHRAMLLRSDFFLAMFSSTFREAQPAMHLQIIAIDCVPDVLEVVLTYLYTERVDFPVEMAVDVLLAADLLFIDRLKLKAAVVLSTLGNGAMHSKASTGAPDGRMLEEEVINIYDVVRAGWLTRVPRLEEFAARYFAYRLESYVEELEFADLIRESASRIHGRQETDSIELLDEYVFGIFLLIFLGRCLQLVLFRIRYYLSERFRLRFEDSGLEDMMDENPVNPINQESITFALDANSPNHGIVVLDNTFDDGATIRGANHSLTPERQMLNGEVRTLDGEIAGDEFAGDAINYQILLGKIDRLLERLKLDA